MSLVCHIEPNREATSNDEIRMTNDETNPNDKIQNAARIAAHSFIIGASSFIRHSAFELRQLPSHLLGHLDSKKIETALQDSPGEIAQCQSRPARRFFRFQDRTGLIKCVEAVRQLE